MRRLLPRLICLLLAAAISIGGLASHAGSALHAAPGHASGSSSESRDTGSLAAAPADLAGDVFLTAADCDGAGHGLGGFCIEARCCAPAVQIAAPDVTRPGFESGKHVIGARDDYALSVAYSLLKPPRAIA